jgi:hypothetical protein
MKKTIFIVLSAFVFIIAGTNNSYGFSNTKPSTNFINGTIKSLRITELVNLSAKQFSELTGKKMNMWDKVSFSIIKIKMKHDLNKNLNLTLSDYYNNAPRKRWGTGKWILVIFLTLLLIPVLIITVASALD